MCTAALGKKLWCSLLLRIEPHCHLPCAAVISDEAACMHGLADPRLQCSPGSSSACRAVEHFRSPGSDILLWQPYDCEHLIVISPAMAGWCAPASAVRELGKLVFPRVLRPGNSCRAAAQVLQRGAARGVLRAAAVCQGRSVRQLDVQVMDEMEWWWRALTFSSKPSLAAASAATAAAHDG